MAITRNKSRLKHRLESSDWNFADSSTRELTHGIHRYSGKFIPQIARQAIELLTEKGEAILDPFCGSGTTLLEAGICGRRAIGTDLNPLAVLVSKVKCTTVPGIELDKILRSFEEDLANASASGMPLFATLEECNSSAILECKNDPLMKDEWFTKWFDHEGLIKLIYIRKLIYELKVASQKNLALVAFSDILRRCSHAASGYPNVMYDKRRRPRPDPIPLFLGRLRETIAAVSTLNEVGFEESVTAELKAAQNTGLEPGSIDAVVTHPPYIGSIPYAEYCAISLKWLGYDPKDLDKTLTGGQRQSKLVLERFLAGYEDMLKESYRVLRPGGTIFLMVGNPLVRGERIDLAKITVELSNKVGFSSLAHTTRQGVNRRANKMGDEDLLFFIKR
jgi:site-specific DNA-methyltransferase (cytosine-N4-specific)